MFEPIRVIQEVKPIIIMLIKKLTGEPDLVTGQISDHIIILLSYDNVQAF